MRPWHTFDNFRTGLGLKPAKPEYKQRRAGIQEYKPNYPRKYICPSASYALKNPEDNLYPLDRSYALNAHPYYYPLSVRIKMTKQSGMAVCMADALDWWFYYSGCDKYSQYGEKWVGFDTYGMAAFRHSNKANVSYWDGHCSAMTAEQLKDGLTYWLNSPPK